MGRLRAPHGSLVTVPEWMEAGYRARGYTDVDRKAGKPSPDDLKAVWEDYARSQGIDPDGMTKAEIVEACGG
jgi:hypothetical protein